jgi:hypothetical protein
MSSDEYTPTTEEVREEFKISAFSSAEFDIRGEAFDRWLAQVERAAAVKALRRAADWADETDPLQYPFNGFDDMQFFLRARADRIEKGEGA